MIKLYSLTIFCIALSINCFGQDKTESRYVVRDLKGGLTYIIDANGNEFAVINSNEYYIRGDHIVNYFDKSEQNMLLTRKTDKRLFSINKEGEISPLPRYIERVLSYNKNKLVYYTTDKLVLSDAHFNTLKSIRKPYSLKSKIQGGFAIQENENSGWQIWNDELELIHNLEVVNSSKIFGYSKGWILVIAPNDDKLLYHISGKKLNVSKLLFENYGIEKNSNNRIGIETISNGVFLIKVGAAYFNLFYLNDEGEFIWKSEKKDIKSATSFENGLARIEKYDTSFEEYSTRKGKHIGREKCSYKTLVIDTCGIVTEIKPNVDKTSESVKNYWDDDIVEEAYPSRIYYSDSLRSLVLSDISRTKRHIALIDHNGKMYWENFAKE